MDYIGWPYDMIGNTQIKSYIWKKGSFNFSL